MLHVTCYMLHDLCHKDSRCQHPGYVCSKKPLTSPQAKEAYMKAITKTTIYKNPSDYLLVSEPMSFYTLPSPPLCIFLCDTNL